MTPGDLCLRLPSGRLNLRVGAVILHEGRLLAMQDENAPYFYLPGGRVQLNETAEGALLREMREELGVEARILRPLWVHQNFFTDTISGERFHEWCLYFLTAVCDPLLMTLGERFTRQEGRHIHVFSWLDVDALPGYDLVPPFLREGAAHLPDSLTLLTRIEGDPSRPADDLSFSTEAGRFGLRVRGLLLHEGRLLTVTEDDYPGWHLPGGRIRLHETAEDALLREMREELGLEASIIRPLWLNQAFFTGADGQPRHEWCLYALMDVPAPLLDRGDAFIRQTGGQTLTFRWMPVDALPETMEPAFLRASLSALPDTLQLVSHTND
ncbi:MAG: NUDIX hydrolase [Aristaeellaceae bacterium]